MDLRRNAFYSPFLQLSKPENGANLVLRASLICLLLLNFLNLSRNSVLFPSYFN